MQTLNKKSYNFLLIDLLLYIILIAMIGDYCITYWGIHSVKTISEANPLMVKFMELPFYLGLSVRFLISLVPILLLKFAEQKVININSYKNVILIVLSLQLYPYILHTQWIIHIFVLR